MLPKFLSFRCKGVNDIITIFFNLNKFVIQQELSSTNNPLSDGRVLVSFPFLIISSVLAFPLSRVRRRMIVSSYSPLSNLTKGLIFTMVFYRSPKPKHSWTSSPG